MRFICVALSLILTGLAFSSPAAAAETDLPFPSFPCSYAALSVEYAICGDQTLRALDWAMDDSYRRARVALLPDNSIIYEQSDWLKKRNECGTTSCIAAHYRNRIAELESYGNSIVGDQKGSSRSPSYDCRRARSGVETTICNSGRLSNLDWEISDVYQRARIANYTDRKSLRKEQNQWIKDRNACNSSVCIADGYRMRITELLLQYRTSSGTAQAFRPATPRERMAPTPQLSRDDTAIVEKLIFNGTKCMAKKWATDRFSSPEEKAVVGAIVTLFFDGELPPAGKVAGSYAVDKFRQWLKENGHADLASALGDIKTADCIMRGVFY